MEGTSMRNNILSVTQAKIKLLELTRSMEEEGRSFVLTKNGMAVGALVPIEDYEALVETFDILENPSLMKKIRRALKQEKEGSLWKKGSKGKWIRAKALKH